MFRSSDTLPFPLPVTVQSLDHSELYNRRVQSRENLVEKESDNNRNGEQSAFLCDYEELAEWSGFDNPPKLPPRNFFKNAYNDDDNDKKRTTNKTGYIE